MEIEKRINFMNDRAMKCEVIWQQRFGHMKTLPKCCGVDKCQLNCDVCITEKRQKKERKKERKKKKKRKGQICHNCCSP
jgi:hypothetical protein